MSLKAFIPTLLLEKPTTGKERDKSSIQCLEACGRNLYIGGKDSLIQHFVVPDASGPGTEGNCTGIREARRRQLGSRSPISQLGAVPFLNHLLVLSDGSLSALNMFSLEPLPALRRIRSVSFFCLHGAAASDQPTPMVELFTASARRRAVSIHGVSVDRWECLREVALPQEPLALAVDGSCLCVAVSDRYFLHDREGGATLDLFPHDLPKQGVIVDAIGKEEFLLQGPGSLVVGGGPGGCGAFPLCADSEEEVHSLSPVAMEKQIKALVASKRVDEALDFVQGVKSLLSKDTYKVLHKNLTCTVGFVKFYQESFPEAKYHFIKGNLDPREIITLYPDLYPVCEDFISQHAAVFNAKDLGALKEDCATFERYRSFLFNFLREVRWTDQSRGCREDVDGALLKLYVEAGNAEDVVELLSSPNDCILSTCVPYLERYKRYYALGLLYQSHGQDYNAIQTWVNIVDGDDPEDVSSVAYEHIVNLLRQQKCGQLVWKFADWALQKSQEVGVQIFSGREEEQDPLREEEVISLLSKHPLALMLYLENLIFALKSKEERHHTLLAMTYITQVLQVMEKGDGSDTTANSTRDKLQQFLWKSTLYSTAAVQEQIRATSLHFEKAILHGVAGEHRKALHILVHGEKDLRAAEDYCRTVPSSQPTVFGHPLYHALLSIYLDSPQLTTKAVDLLNRNAASFDPVAVLQALPGAWSMALVSRFLSESVRGLVHRSKMGGVERNLAKVEHFRHRCTRTTLTRGMIKVERGQICQRCGRYLNEPEFLRSLKGELIHTHCWSNEHPPT
ncbi:hypothetical protein SKAU_G00342300 [Synaphobranchus kaupii]|uniref:CNH domain-containing protein n=1 Tax=Synaphobranchus kaupii TaxID=118154 RepID=A0A9Q1IJN2_SYNKA|nr:hypothetical protein SKAU_G00342300 [Synaphobranchus kaupii]